MRMNPQAWTLSDFFVYSILEMKDDDSCWEDDSVVKRTCSSSRDPKLSSQHSCLETHTVCNAT